MTAPARSCAACSAFQPYDRSEGECRALAPMTRGDAYDSSPRAAWPVVDGTDWCRAFEARQTSDTRGR